MKLLSWNIRGLGNSKATDALAEKIKRLNPHVIFLMETKLNRKRMESLRKRLGFHNGIDWPSDGASGGLSLGWKREVKVSFISASNNHISIKIDDDMDGNSWKLTGFYGAPEVHNRPTTWDLLRSQHDPDDAAWLVIGDFNEILYLDEKEGGNPRAETQMDDFRQALDSCKLTDIGYKGSWFTWSRGKRVATSIRERLDRGVANDQWRDLFPHFLLRHQVHNYSDHCPSLLNTSERFSIERRFRFEASWCLEDGLEDVVRKLWTFGPTNIPDRIVHMGVGLLDWSKDMKLNRTEKRRELETKLAELNELPISDDVLDQILHTKLDLGLEISKECLYWKVRGKTNWLENGDRNTTVFHNKASFRRRINKICGLRNDSGHWTENQGEIVNIAETFYRDIFTTQGMADATHLLGGVSRSITDSMNAFLEAPFIEEEIANAVRDMSPIKSPGPDGLPALFFQKFWHIIGKDIGDFCLNILNRSSTIDAINLTDIVLIPKVDDPFNITQFRPIALCNVLYKIVAKAIACRFKQVLGKCIDEEQSAFVPGRLISDNILIAYEILHSMKSDRGLGPGSFALKLDMSKAYDRVEWDFVEQMMMKMGFSPSWINLLMHCVKTVRYRVNLNGKVGAEIIPSRGLRQGDSLSPYLFLICSQGLSSLFNLAKRDGYIDGFRLNRSSPRLTHLLFADDCVAFGKASVEGARAVCDVIREYEAVSGQRVNFDKSLLFFSANTLSRVRNTVGDLLAVRVSTDMGNYLGLPAMVGRNKRAAFRYLTDRLRAKIESWSYRLLSQGGKEVFIKSVLQALPIYAMTVFLLPKSLCKEINSIISNYWWKSSNRGIHWLNWDAMCESKDVGGMGFRDMAKFNVAMLSKQAWRLFYDPGSLAARFLRAKYYRASSFLESNLGSNPSLTWRSIWSSKKLLTDGLSWRVGNGCSISIWNDRWIPNFPQADIQHYRNSDSPQHVFELIAPGSNSWNFERLAAMFPPEVVTAIVSLPLPYENMPDMLIWGEDNTGVYTVKSGYKLLIKLSPVGASNQTIDPTLRQTYWCI